MSPHADLRRLAHYLRTATTKARPMELLKDDATTVNLEGLTAPFFGIDYVVAGIRDAPDSRVA